MKLEEADTDGSGDLSEAEFVAYHTERMKRFYASLDRNGDGKLTPDELARIQRGAKTNPNRLRPGQPKLRSADKEK